MSDVLMREVKSSFPKGRPNLTQRFKWFATVSTSTLVAVLPWRFDAKMQKWAPQTRCTLRRKGLFIQNATAAWRR